MTRAMSPRLVVIDVQQACLPFAARSIGVKR